MSHYLSVFPVGDTWRNLPLLLLFDCHLQQKGDVNCNMFWQATSFWFFNIKWKQNVSNISTNCTFLLGECMTGAGGEGGPRGIFLLILKNTIIAIKFLHHFPQTGGGNYRYWKVSSWTLPGLHRKNSQKDSYNKWWPCNSQVSFHNLFKNYFFIKARSLNNGANVRHLNISNRKCAIITRNTDWDFQGNLTRERTLYYK